jgi:pantoate--beta-alanine ligase
MKVFKTVKGLQNHIAKLKKAKKRIGYVPTLGALHEGHMSLIRLANDNCDITVCSIFVNPTQFNEKSDLSKYPRTYDADSRLLKENNCNILFFPDVKQIYPKDIDTTVKIDFGKLDSVMEGAHRPGHFDGVAQVVKRLLDIVKPHELVMGQKDFQQVAIIRHMLTELKIKTKLVIGPTVREDHGLAMSSRNERLSKKLRQDAAIINKTLLWVKDNIKKYDVATLEKKAIKKMSLPKFKPEYFEIADGITLQPIKTIGRRKYVVACTAVWAGKVRLIDNCVLVDKLQ